jgi:DNA helicase HerA-like ATPase
VRINVEAAVPTNTVILGVIGSGKTHAAWELIRRALAEGTKVLVLDITGRYSREFRDILDSDTESGIAGVINQAIKSVLGRRDVDTSNEAGNVIPFRKLVRDFLEDFITSRYQLIVVNPADLRVTRMEGYPRDGKAQSLAELTPAEVTRHFAEMALQVYKRRDKATIRSPLLWIVLEEAHSLVPEMNSTAVAAEQRSAMATSRAILQGRKYGLGCLVVTQRTANVSKTLLTQCNTLIAMRTMDATGVEFVGTMVGASTAELLPAIPERQALVFGLASSCPNPVIVELNDYFKFREAWRRDHGAFQRTVWDSPSTSDV